MNYIQFNKYKTDELAELCTWFRINPQECSYSSNYKYHSNILKWFWKSL